MWSSPAHCLCLKWRKVIFLHKVHIYFIKFCTYRDIFEDEKEDDEERQDDDQYEEQDKIEDPPEIDTTPKPDRQ